MPVHSSKEEAAALLALRTRRLTGRMDCELPEHAAQELQSKRFAHPDEYGDLQLTERGEEHLRQLEHAGKLKDLPSPALKARPFWSR